MARNGPYGQPGVRAPTRRTEQDPYPPIPQHHGHPHHAPLQPPLMGQPGMVQPGLPPAGMPWPHPGYADPQSGSDGYHFPQQAAPETPYEYAPQQWGDPQAPRGYDLGTYSPAAPQGYGPAGGPPFQTAPDAQAPYPGQPQGYGELDETYAEDWAKMRRSRAPAGAGF